MAKWKKIDAFRKRNLYIKNSCDFAKGKFFLQKSAFHRDSFFFFFFSRKKSRHEWTNVATMSHGISARGARNNTAGTNQRYPLLCTRQPSKKLRNIQRILDGTREEEGKERRRPERRSSAGHGLMKFNYGRRPGPR